MVPPVVPEFDDPLERIFYERPATDVAQDLLGCYLLHKRAGRIAGGRIVEVEAYGGPGDPGSHADRAPHGRARLMFGPPGVAYVYFTYGMHHCINAVTEPQGRASAVLLRALEPVWGERAMRNGAPAGLADHLVTSGPGRLTRALAIDRTHNGSDLVGGPIRIVRGCKDPGQIRKSGRIGLSTDDDREWRFFLDSPSVSRSPRRGRRP